MPLPIDERKEILAYSKNKTHMQSLRSAIAKKYPGSWLMVHCDESAKIYGVEIASVWGVRLQKTQEDEIREFAKEWVKEHIKD